MQSGDCMPKIHKSIFACGFHLYVKPHWSVCSYVCHQLASGPSSMKTSSSWIMKTSSSWMMDVKLLLVDIVVDLKPLVTCLSARRLNNSQLCFRKLKLIFLKSATDLSTDQKYLTFAVIKGIVLNAGRDPGAV